MEVKTIEIDKGFPLQVVKKVITCFKPIRNEKGGMQYKDLLQYLVKVLPQDDPSYSVVLSLASYSTTKFIKYYKSKGGL